MTQAMIIASQFRRAAYLKKMAFDLLGIQP